MRVAIAWVSACVVLMVLLSGCAQANPPASAPSSAPVPQVEGSATADAPADAPAGLVKQEDGTAAATGWLAYSDIEGGFYTLVDRAGETIVVLVPSAEDEFGADLPSLVGAYLLVSGELSDGPSIRMAGQELVVSQVEVLKEAPSAP